MGSERMAALVESYGPERLIVNSACDRGVSDPLAVPKTVRLMAQRGVGATPFIRSSTPMRLRCTD